MIIQDAHPGTDQLTLAHGAVVLAKRQQGHARKVVHRVVEIRDRIFEGDAITGPELEQLQRAVRHSQERVAELSAAVKTLCASARVASAAPLPDALETAALPRPTGQNGHDNHGSIEPGRKLKHS